MKQFLEDHWGILLFMIIVVGLSIGTIVPFYPTVPKQLQENVGKRNPTLSNDEIIAEVKKCEAAGLKGLARFWVQGKDGGTDGIADIICLPVEQYEKYK